MAVEDRGEPIQFDGDALDEARAMSEEIRSGLVSLSNAMSRVRTGADRPGYPPVKHVVVTLGSFKACFFDDDWNCIECWEDPPGISRPCNGDDSMSPGPAAPLTILEP